MSNSTFCSPRTFGVIISLDKDSVKVLDQNSGIKTVPSKMVRMMRDNPNATARDAVGNTIRVGDAVTLENDSVRPCY
jgi:transcription elongation factor